MYQPRATRFLGLDAEQTKLYSISAQPSPVPIKSFQERLIKVKQQRQVAWQHTASFAIFHQGMAANYLVLCWWGNDNELFTSVSVEEQQGWVEDPSLYSFCLWDLEVIWAERNSYIQTVYSGKMDTQTGLSNYRKQYADISSTV